LRFCQFAGTPHIVGSAYLQLYLSPYSDVVALLVFDHQMMNLLTRVGWEARYARSETPRNATARLQSAAQELVDYLLKGGTAGLFSNSNSIGRAAEKGRAAENVGL
jgi:hypothetical protein